MIRVLFLYLIIELILMLSSCSTLDDCGDFTASEASVGNIIAHSINFDSFDNFELLTGRDTVASENFGIWLEVDPEFIGKIFSGGSNSLYACSVLPPLLTESISTLEIFTINDLDDELTSGSDLTQRFVIEDFESDFPISNAQRRNELFRELYYLYLTPDFELPTDQFVQFGVDIQLNDGELFQLSTTPVYVISN